MYESRLAKALNLILNIYATIESPIAISLKIETNRFYESGLYTVGLYQRSLPVPL